MSLHRFELIDRFFQIKAKITSDKPCLEKAEPLLKISNKFNPNYTPSNRLSVDEIVARFKGKFRYKTYNKNKPTKWGIKIFALADSLTGFCLQLMPYFGTEKTYTNLDDLIPNFMQDYANKNVKVYMDNYYSHPTLFLKLKDLNIESTGTFRQNRRDIPKIIKEAKTGKITTSKQKRTFTLS